MAYELLEDEPDTENSYLESGLNAGKEVLRHGARTLSNLGTQAVGLPGDIFSLVNDFIARPAVEAISGEKGLEYKDTLLGKILPTTQTHRERLDSSTDGYLKPENEVEKWADNVIEDTAMLFSPVKIAKMGISKGTNLFKNLAKSLGANFLGETTKQVSQSENAGNIAKMGSLFVLSLIDQESAAKQVGKLYKEAEKHLPKDASTSAKSLNKNLDSLENSITKSRPRGNLSAPEKFVVDQVDKIKNLIQNDKISIEQAIAQKRSLNKELSTLYKEVPKHSDQKNVKSMAKQLNGFLSESIGEYGKSNPKFYKPYKNADQAFGTLAKSNFISHWIDNNVIQHPLTTGLLHVFSPATSIAGAAILPYQATKLTYRIAKSPTLAKVYAKTVKSALKEDSVVFNKYLRQLDEGLQKEESDDRFEFID